MNDSDHIFVIRENTRLKHRCPLTSFVQYNVPRFDTLTTELMDIDFLALSETWLNQSTPTEDLMIESSR